MRWESLKPFTETGISPEVSKLFSTLKVEARLAFDSEWVLEFRVHQGTSEGGADLPELRGLRAEGLWKGTCFEAFFGVAGSEAYYEFNGALNGDWDLYAFDSYRSGMRRVEVPAVSGAEAGEAAPTLTSPTLTHRSSDPLTVGFRIPAAMIGVPGQIDRVGLTVVWMTSNGPTYWALNHSGMKPDFHLRSSFTYDPIRN